MRLTTITINILLLLLPPPLSKKSLRATAACNIMIVKTITVISKEGEVVVAMAAVKAAEK